MKKFMVLFIQPVGPFQNPPPMSIVILSTVLKENNIAVKVFDTAFYEENGQQSLDKTKEENFNVKPFSFDGYPIPKKIKKPEEDLSNLVSELNPDLICMTILEPAWHLAENLLNALVEFEKPVICGGVFPTFAPDIVFTHPAVNMVCVGEGEEALTELCVKMKNQQNYDDLKNIWVKKKNGTILKNPIRKVVNINTLPFPDFDFFDKARLLRPMAGKIYKTIPVETNRGCPFSCTFCNSPSNATNYKKAGAGTFFRKKSIERINSELDFQNKKYNPEYFFFLSDTFLLLTDREFDIFVNFYKKNIHKPFWMQSRIETITTYKAKKLKEIGCHRMSIGLEHGNEEFRHKILKKKYKNIQMIKSTEIIFDAGIPFTLNNIIGFPDETRELIFDTIKLNSLIPFDSANAYAYAPFHGTPLREYCLEKRYIKPKDIAGCFTLNEPLNMPQLSAEEIEGLRKVFLLYTKMPKKYWPEIKKAEENSNEGYSILQKLRKIYKKKYL